MNLVKLPSPRIVRFLFANKSALFGDLLYLLLYLCMVTKFITFTAEAGRRTKEAEKPNVILILADDLGKTVLSTFFTEIDLKKNI